MNVTASFRLRVSLRALDVATLARAAWLAGQRGDPIEAAGTLEAFAWIVDAEPENRSIVVALGAEKALLDSYVNSGLPRTALVPFDLLEGGITQ